MKLTFFKFLFCTFIFLMPIHFANAYHSETLQQVLKPKRQQSKDTGAWVANIGIVCVLLGGICFALGKIWSKLIIGKILTALAFSFWAIAFAVLLFYIILIIAFFISGGVG